MILNWSPCRISIAVICFPLILSACTGTRMIVPTPTPLDPNRSVVGLSLKGGGAFAPTAVYFLRLQDNQDAATGTQVIESNYL